MESIVDVVEQQANARGSTPFVSEGDRTMTFAETFEEIARLAYVLHDYGVRAGDRVLVAAESRTKHLLSYFASMSIGAIPVHLNTQRPRWFVEFAAENTGARVLLTHDYAVSWPDMPLPVLPYPTLDASVPMRWERERSDIAYMMFTSGTTGRPKAVMTSQANTLFTARTIIDFAALTASERELISLPLSFTFGLGHLHSQLILGGQARLFGSMRDYPGLMRLMAGDGITGFLASPGMIRALVEDHTEEFVRSTAGLRYIVINCTPMPVPLTRRLLELLPGTRSYMYYGLTEASRSAFIHYNANPGKLACTGKATNGVALRIDDPAPGTGEGEVCIKGPNVMPGYWGDTSSTCIDAGGWFHTGDLGVIDGDGYITVRGRLNDQISIDGIKCQPLEVEQILNLHPAVRESAVAGISDEKTFQAVAAAVVTANGLAEDSLAEDGLTEDAAQRERLAAELAAFCRAHLEPQKIPTRFVFIDAVPRTDLGKIVRSEVRNMFTDEGARVVMVAPPAAPMNAVPAAVAHEEEQA